MDRAVWIGLGRAPQIEVDVPTIAIEFVSGRLRDRRRDYVDKRQEYAEVGVKEYWIVDRSRRQFVCFRGPDEEIVLSDGVYRTSLMPGFELSIPALMAAAAKYD
jgi:Uma2 family endonuclease